MALRLAWSRGDGWSEHELLGRRVRVRDSFRTSMLLRSMLEDPDVEPEEKAVLAQEMVLVDPEGFSDAFDDPASAFGKLCDEALGVSAFLPQAEAPEGKPVLDFDADEMRIRATMRQAYGLGDEFRDLPYLEVMALIALAPSGTPMGDAMYYRTAKTPSAKDVGAKGRERFLKMQSFYRLGRDEDDAEVHL